MNQSSDYTSFLKENGKPLSEINPGSNEFALTVSDALHALELLKESQTVILGGDVLSEENGRLVYAYQLWGEQYIYLNWFCDKHDIESQIEYCMRSYEVAKESIYKTIDVSKQLEMVSYIVLVVQI